MITFHEQSLRRGLAAALLGLAAPLALAGYFQWDMVELPGDTGAACGNGTPYRFFVNRTPDSKNLAIVYEGGGACWDQKACLGSGALAAANPGGIAPDYMVSLSTQAVLGLVTPFTARNNPFQAVQTQSWNIVYVPYCTGDVHTGSKVVVYTDADPANPRIEYHRGQANIRAAAKWLRDNLGQPQDLMLTGFSAGGVGSTATYGIVREALMPTGRASLIADSGPLMQAPRSGTPQQYPSLLLHNKIREAWGLDEAGGLIDSYAGALPGFDPGNLGSVNIALARAYPADRFSFVTFLADNDFSAFSYDKFYPAIANEPNPFFRRQLRLALWEPELASYRLALAGEENIAFYQPFFRNVNASHCLTIIDFSGTGIQELGIADLNTVIDDTLNRGTNWQVAERDHFSDYVQPLSLADRLFNLLTLLAKLLG